MRALARLRSWWLATMRPGRMESEMDAELAAHIAAHTEYLISTGIPAEEAQRRARLEFGAIGPMKEACRDARGANLLPSLAQDLAFGLRMLGRSPGFAALSIVTLALGIGATTAVFSVVNGVLLRQLPYRNPDQLVYVWEPNPRIPNVPLAAWGPSNADYYDWKNQNHCFAELALFSTDRPNLLAGGSAVRVNSSRVTGEFFATLGIGPQFGRAIGPEDDRPGNGAVAVIGSALWHSQFGADPKVLDKTLLLNARSYRIVGVMPAGFAFPHGSESLDTAGQATDIWVPFAMSPEERADRDGGPGNAIARLKPGVPIDRAQSEIAAITARFDPLHQKELQGSTAALRGFDVMITGGSRRALLVFLAAVLLVLLIAASNVAGLVLARSRARAREFSLRTALGASRARLIRQLATESLCLAGAGGILGVAAAWLAVRLLVYFHPANIPRLDEVSLDARVLCFAVFASLATVVFCGLAPGWSNSRSEINEVLKSSGNRAVRGSLGGLHRALTVGQVALTFVLLAASGLLIRSFLTLLSVDKGFHPSSVVTVSLQLDGRYEATGRRQEFFRTLLQRASAVKGIEAAAEISRLPLGGGQTFSLIEVEGFGMDMKTLFEDRAVTPNYFAAMGIPMLEGRDFTEDDVSGRQPVIIVNRSFARHYFPGQSALGKRVHTSGHRVIVGVVADVRQWSLEDTPPMQFYNPLWQTGSDSANLVVRSRLPQNRAIAELKSVVRGMDPAVAADIRTGVDLVSAATAERRFQTLLLAGFGALALFLSLVGLYGLMSDAVELRTAEIGIRMALGAQPGGVMRLILAQGSRMALAGIALGIAAAWFAMRSIASLLFEVKPADPLTFFAAAGLFAMVALAACYLPARRAIRIDPLVSLRAE